MSNNANPSSDPGTGPDTRQAVDAESAEIQESQQLLSDQANIPDGPNVAPSPFEHLAARGNPDPAQPEKNIAQAEGPGVTTAPSAANRASKSGDVGLSGPE